MASKPPLPIEEVARLPLPGTAIPGAFAFSPDGQRLEDRVFLEEQVVGFFQRYL
jgi:hypothetical protein